MFLYKYNYCLLITDNNKSTTWHNSLLGAASFGHSKIKGLSKKDVIIIDHKYFNRVS